MKAERTQGPWYHRLVERQKDGLLGYVVYGENQEIISESFPQPYKVHVNEANAMLLAAAPELLAAAEEAKKVLLRLSKDTEGELSYIINDLYNAISKANGK